MRGIGGEAAFVLQGAFDIAEQGVQPFDQGQDLAWHIGSRNRRQPIRRAGGDIFGEAAQRPEGDADRHHQHQGQAGQRDQHGHQQVFRDLMGELAALLAQVLLGGRRVVEQLLDFVQGRTPGECRGDQPDHGDGKGGQQHQPGAQGKGFHVSFAMT